MTTLKDISAELGLSVATVSRALNGFPEVSAKTRSQVQEVARRLNYRPNRLAQKLQSGRSGLIGMVVRHDPKDATERSFMEIVLGLTRELSKQDLDMVFQVSVGDDPLEPYRRLVEKKTVDAFILNAPEQDDPRISYLRAVGIPFVVHGRAGGVPDYPFYDVDNAGVGFLATRMLADLGHRRTVLINGPEGRSFSVQRMRGYFDGLAEAGLRPSDGLVLHDDGAPDFGYRSALRMLANGEKQRPTAILCASTTLAEGVYRAAADLGLGIPGDLSVIAHDDVVPEMSGFNFRPTLTVTQAPMREACEPLARILVRTLAQPKGDDPIQITRQADLLPRGSTATPPKPR